MGFVISIYSHKNSSYFGRSKHKCDPVGDVGGKNTKFISGIHSEMHQSLGKIVNAFVELGVCKAQIPVRINHEILVRSFSRPFFQKLTERFIC